MFEPADDHVLDARTMARFVSQGFLRFDALVPDDINRAVIAELEAQGGTGWCRYNQARLGPSEFFAGLPAYTRMLALPRVQGIVRSLVGPRPLIDHLAAHVVPAGCPTAQRLHADATVDPRTEAFDIQIFYYPHDTPREAGGTLIVPGSHLRRVHEMSIARYQNIVGQMAMVCPAGTLMVAHHGIWHCGQPNRGARTRSMMKLRLDPSVRQRGLFPPPAPDDEEVARHLVHGQEWFGVDHRLEILQRLRLWRSLTGSDYDIDLWLGRIENQPRQAAPRLQAVGAG